MKTINTTEIKCPHCGETIVLDKTAYASIAQQVRDKELSQAVQDAQAHFDRELSAITAKHKAEMEALIAKKDAETQEAIAKSEAESNAFYEAANENVEHMKSEIKIIKAENEASIRAADEKLKSSLAAAEREKNAAVVEAKAQTAKDYADRIAKLEAQVYSAEKERKLAVSEAQQSAQTVITAKDRKIDDLHHQLEQQKSEHALALRQKDEEIGFYKDFKLRQSTKMLGESLEQHCLASFEMVRHAGFPRAHFEKDNDASGGSKGDFIYRDFDEHGVEFISVMFEMKNEADDTARKHKNEEFFKKLDADRTAKGCEYAVLVSTLESDSEVYNTGIIDVSHRYPKMYVVRPNFFLPLLSILRNAAAKTAEYREEAEMLRNQHFDVRQFAERLTDFKDKFGKSYAGASKQFETSISEIDKAIDHLQKTKNALLSSAKHLESANSKVEDMTLKRLTRGNPTMKKKFKDAGIDVALM